MFEYPRHIRYMDDAKDKRSGWAEIKDGLGVIRVLHVGMLILFMQRSFLMARLMM